MSLFYFAVMTLITKTSTLFQAEHDAVTTKLESKCVPVSLDSCRHCADPCDEDHLEYPAKLDVDMEPGMFGTVKPYARQIVISTGRTDWAREVTEDDDTLAQHIATVNTRHQREREQAGADAAATAAPPPAANGHSQDEKWPELWETADPAATRLSVLNGSHTSSEDGMANVLVLPDYKMVRVPESAEGAETLWSNALDPALRRAGRGSEDQSKSWLLPYSCVILLCSHKRRDNRCSIVAPKLLQSFTAQLEFEGWQVDHNIDENYDDWGQSLESIEGTDVEREAEVKRRLADPDRLESNKVLILRNSHVGGHKYAGNVILCFPSGANVWYGRVTPHEVTSIVKNTITNGKVLPSLMRGGMNLSRKSGKHLLEW